MKNWQERLSFFLGVLCTTIGLGMIYEPLVFIFLGILYFCCWAGMAMGRKKHWDE